MNQRGEFASKFAHIDNYLKPRTKIDDDRNCDSWRKVRSSYDSTIPKNLKIGWINDGNFSPDTISRHNYFHADRKSREKKMACLICSSHLTNRRPLTYYLDEEPK